MNKKILHKMKRTKEKVFIPENTKSKVIKANNFKSCYLLLYFNKQIELTHEPRV